MTGNDEPAADPLPRAQGVLRFDWERVHGEVVSAALASADPNAPLGPGADERLEYADLALVTAAGVIVLRVDHETDEIRAELEPALPDTCPWVPAEPLADFVGQELGWAWSCINSQGYWDMLVLSADGPVPQTAFVAMASTIWVKRLAEVLS